MTNPKPHTLSEDDRMRAVDAIQNDSYLTESEKSDGHIQTIWFRAAEWATRAANARGRKACRVIILSMTKGIGNEKIPTAEEWDNATAAIIDDADVVAKGDQP